MIEWVLDNIAPIHGIDTVYVVTNNKFAHDFRVWAEGYAAKLPANLKNIAFKIVNDGSTSDDDKKGAIGDIHSCSTRSTFSTTTSSWSPATTSSASRSQASARSARRARDDRRL